MLIISKRGKSFINHVFIPLIEEVKQIVASIILEVFGENKNGY